MRHRVAKLGHELLAHGRSRNSVWLHGILGSRKNWRTPARKMITDFPHFQAVVVDHRGHGTSEEGPGPHSLESCALDLHHLLQHELSLGSPHVCSGHSFGGKVAIAYTQACLDHGWEPPRHTWVFDSLPGRVDKHRAIGENSVAEVIEKLEEVEMPWRGTKEQLAAHLITDKRIPRSIASWLMTSVNRAPDGQGLVWAFSLPVIRALFESYTDTDYYDLLARWPEGHTVSFIRAGKNSAWTPDVLHKFDLIQRDRKNVRLHTLEQAGHWVHVDDPHGLVRLISPSFHHADGQQQQGS